MQQSITWRRTTSSSWRRTRNCGWWEKWHWLRDLVAKVGLLLCCCSWLHYWEDCCSWEGWAYNWLRGCNSNKMKIVSWRRVRRKTLESWGGGVMSWSQSPLAGCSSQQWFNFKEEESILWYDILSEEWSKCWSRHFFCQTIQCIKKLFAHVESHVSAVSLPESRE